MEDLIKGKMQQSSQEVETGLDAKQKEYYVKPDVDVFNPVSDDLSDIDFINDIFVPRAQANELYSSEQINFFKRNEIDTAPLFGQEAYSYAGKIPDLKPENASEEEKQSFTDMLRDAFKMANDWSESMEFKPMGEAAVDMAKATPGFLSDVAEAAPGYTKDTLLNWKDRLILAGKNMEDVGVNLSPFLVEYLQKTPGFITAPFVAGLDPDEVYEKAAIRSKEIDKEKEAIKKDLEGREDIFQMISGIIMQDAPGTLATYQVVKNIPYLPQPAKIILSWGIGSALSFDEKDTLDNAFLDSVMINKIKEFYEIIPDTPEEELVEKAYQIFEYSATGALFDGILRFGKFLKKFPAFAQKNPKTVGAAATATAVSTPTDTEALPISKLGKTFVEKGGKRIIGLSQETPGKVPTTFEQQVGAKQLQDIFSADPGVNAFKVDDSFGKYGDNVERNFDIEFLVNENYNDELVLTKALDIAQKNNQEAVLYSKSTSIDNPKANAGFSVNFKEPLYYKDAQKQIDDMLKKYDINEGYTAKTGLIDFNQSKVMELPKPNQQVIEAAKAKFKPTTNMANAGYILPDGTLLDLGRSYGSGRGGAVEHRDVAAIAIGGQKPGNASDLFEFMKQTGAIRISPYDNRLFGQTYYKPTKQQVRAFKQFNDNGYEEMVIDGVFPGQDMEKQLFQTNTANRIFEVMPGEKFNPAEFEKFFDPQMLSSKQYAGMRSIFVPEFSNSNPKQYVKSILSMEKELKDDSIIGSVDLEFFDTNVITKKDYGKFRK